MTNSIDGANLINKGEKLFLVILTLVLFSTFMVYPVQGADPAEYYQDGIRVGASQVDYSRDIKQVVKADGCQKLIDFPGGYEMKLPLDVRFDFDRSPAFVRAYSDNLDIKVSRESSPYADVEMYFDQYLYRYINSEEYRRANRIELIEDKWISVNGCKTRYISFRRIPAEGSREQQNGYVFAGVMTGGQTFYNLFFRTHSLEETGRTIDEVLQSLKTRRPVGAPAYNLQLRPAIPAWNEETLAFYNQLRNRQELMWGFFSPGALDNYSRAAQIEEILDHRFEIILHYLYLEHPFPTEGMKRAYERGQVVELTLQTASTENDGGFGYNINFDLLDGRYDEQLRQFAREARDFGHPFLFRLNNEMNTDWSRYSGVLLLSDPDLYVKVWRKVYQIFEEEGVNNAIWVFNPNDRDYPPTNWNSHAAYYPGNGYVHVIGLTGYNTGSYFKSVTGEHWRSFTEVYEPLVKDYRGLYGEFPWIITEFSCSSVGGDKERWIYEMFDKLPLYPEIKAAVWWSYADFDQLEGEIVPARRYWLEEKAEYLRAFKAGLHKIDPEFVSVETHGLEHTCHGYGDAGSFPVSIELNGERIDLEVPAYTARGRVMAPARQLLNALGAEVEWEDGSGKVICRRGETVIVFQLDNRKTTVNGQTVELEEPPYLIGGRVVVPLRIVAEVMGAQVAWSEDTRTVSIAASGGSEAAGGGNG